MTMNTINTNEFTVSDRKGLQDWLFRNALLPRSGARRVAQQVDRNLGGIAGRSDEAVQVETIRALGNFLSTEASDRKPDRVAFGEGAAMAGEVLKFLLPLLRGAAGTRELPGKEVIVEEGSGFAFFDDANAPVLTRLSGMSTGTCCKIGAEPGLEVELEITVNDIGGTIGNNSGVKTVEIYGRSQDGVRQQFGGDTVWELTDEQQETSEDQDVKRKMTVCVPCAFVRSGFVRILVEITDNDSNKRFVVRDFAVSAASKSCCGGGQPQ